MPRTVREQHKAPKQGRSGRTSAPKVDASSCSASDRRARGSTAHRKRAWPKTGADWPSELDGRQEPALTPLVEVLAAAFAEVSSRAEHPSRVMFAVPALDRMLRQPAAPGRVTVIVSRPSEGKSALLYQALAVLAGHGAHVLLFLTEGRREDAAVRFAGLWPTDMPAEVWGQMTDRAAEVANLPIRIADRLRSLDAIETAYREESSRSAHTRTDRDTKVVATVVAIDSIDAVELEGCAQPRAEQLATVMRRLSKFAVEQRVHILATAHLAATAPMESNGGSAPWPSLHPLDSCVPIVMVADAVVMLRSTACPHDTGRLVARRPVQIAVAKNRAGGCGSLWAWIHVDGTIVEMTEDESRASGS